MDRALELLKKNLKLLKNNDEDLLKIEKLFLEEREILAQVEQAGWKNLLIRNGQSLVPFHRQQNPFGEVDRPESEVMADYLICIGTGYAYHVPNLILNNPNVSKFLLVETCFEALFVFLTEFDLQVFLPENVEVIYAPEPEQLVQFLNLELPRFQQSQIKFESLESQRLLSPGYVDEVASQLETTWERQQIYHDSLIEQTAEIFANVKANLPLLKQTRFFQENSGAGERVLLVASGPSLEPNLPLVKALSEYVQIVCVGSALNILINAGIRPNLVVVSDPMGINTLHFPSESYDLDLAFEMVVPRDIPNKFEGNKLVTHIGHAIAELLLVDLPVQRIEGWGTVTSCAFSLCEKAGFEEIVLLGSDLSYIGAKTHSGNYRLGSNASRSVSRRDILGRDVGTSSIFANYADFLSQQVDNARKNGQQVINCCDGGLVDNCQVMSLSHYFQLVKQEGKLKSKWSWASPEKLSSGEIIKISDRIKGWLAKAPEYLEMVIRREISLTNLLSVTLLSAFEGHYHQEVKKLEAAILNNDNRLAWQYSNKILTILKQKTDEITGELDKLAQS